MHVILYKETSKVDKYTVEVIIGKHEKEDYFGRAYIYNDDTKRNLLYYASYWSTPMLHVGFAVFEGGFIETNLYPFDIDQIISSAYDLFRAVVNKEISYE